MANSYFQFKQFRVQHDQCAMKVCTDSCVLGAYADVSQATRILDIGTGTGLLALMAAQRTQAPVDAIEIDPAAARQAEENAAASPWAAQIRIIQADVLTWAETTAEHYDCIISNPPFFANHLKRPRAEQNVALHSEALQLSQLAAVTARLLEPKGLFTVLLPPYESQCMEAYCQEQLLYKRAEVRLFDYVGGKQIRSITQFGWQKPEHLHKEELTIKTSASGAYTEAFTGLLKPYYLYL